ncbi:MAG: ABC transporter permease [Methanosarcinaceae archaeon]|nr:ABC transporter permease [Methanosarcinaceae archaeon]MDD4331983.1 ABC transporter permease [Methanosarcinaceae archaeon]MDD4749446.1 ABC transporter permease [Methanosarcinaceae archaeon]
MNFKFIKTLRQKSVEVVSVLSVIVLWQFTADWIVQNKLKLPSFYDVLVSFFSILESGSFFTDLLISLLHFGIGTIAAFLVGIPLGIAMGWFKKTSRAMDPIIEILRPIPPLAWIPFAMAWFGLTPTAAGFIVFMGMVFPIIINTYTGFKNIPKIYVEAAKVLGCNSNRELIRYVALPSAMPSIVAGIRIAMGVGWMCLVAAEMFGVNEDGLGYELWQSSHLHRMNFVLMYMLLLGFLGLFIDRSFRYYAESKLLKWKAGIVV